MAIMIVNSKSGRVQFKNSYGQPYSGEKDMGNLRNWSIFNSDSNDILNTTFGLLVERSATLYHTYQPARGAINKQTDYAIGPGLVFRSQPDFNTLGKSKDWGKEWGKQFQKIVASYYSRMNFFEKQGVLFRTGLYGGDSFLFFLRKEGLLDDLIETQNNQIDWRYQEEGYTHGIKHDKWLRREAVRKTDGKTVPFKNEDSGNQNLVQFYIKELARQLRGYPLAYSIINMARNDDTLNDAVLQRAVIESILMGVFKSDGSTNFPRQARNLAEKNTRAKQGLSPFKKVGSAEAMGSGNIITTGENENLEFTDLKTPSNNYGDFKSVILDYIGMATGTPPEVIRSRYSTSFTAHKGALNDFSKSFMDKRVTFSRTVCNVVNKEILKDAVKQGFIEAPGFLTGGWYVEQAYLRGMYLGPVPGHISPLIEVKAEELNVKNAFKLRSDIAATNAYEWDSMITEWSEEQTEYTSAPQDNKANAIYKQETGV